MKPINFILFLIILAACNKSDVAIVLPKTEGNIKTGKVTLGNSYLNQVYYQLSTDSFRSNDLLIWDIGFECAPEANYLIINGGKEVQVLNTELTNFDSIKTLPAKTDWLWDDPNGDQTHSAFGVWFEPSTHQSKKLVYIVDRGQMEANRYKKIQLIGVDDQKYLLQYANLDGSELNVIEIWKNYDKNHVYLNLSQTPAVHDLEPSKLKWDILFTRYRHVYYELTPITPYSVTGVLLNPHNTQVFRDSTTGFEQINIQYALSLNFSAKSDLIGFDWKHYDFNTARYMVKPNLTYIIKSNNGFYYKLRFVDFYDTQGLKGTPQFEIQQL